MFSKLSKGYGKEDVPPHKRFKANVGYLFLSNDISGVRAQSLCADAVDAGATASCLKRMARAGGGGKKLGNCARDIQRQQLRQRHPKAAEGEAYQVATVILGTCAGVGHEDSS